MCAMKSSPDNGDLVDKQPSDGAPFHGSHNTSTHVLPVPTLRGHKSAVHYCSWHPSRNLLATGAGDSTARIWNLDDTERISSQVLDHKVQNERNKIEANKDLEVRILDWNYDYHDPVLATGVDDEFIRIWTVKGDLVKTFGKPVGHLRCLKWNKEGSYIISAGCHLIGYRWREGRINKRFAGHSEPVLDVEWLDNCSFVSCSKDKRISLYNIRSNKPHLTFLGHTDYVNSVRCGPMGTLLASCSDDMSIKIWKLDQNTPIHDLKQHSGEVRAIQWSPTGLGTRNPNASRVLASASYDCTVRLWNPDSGKCIRKLTSHSGPVFSLAFSPDGKYLASVGRDNCIKIWTVQNGTLLFNFRSDGAIYDACWSNMGYKVAVVEKERGVYVLDMRKILQWFMQFVE